MTQLLPGRTLVLSGYGFDESGPYLKLNDQDAGRILRFPVRGRTFSLRRLGKRYCIGRFDLQTFEESVCPLGVELLADSKETVCPACAEATGFNPSFYYSDFVSPQQRAYNATPHFTYLAYFSPNHVKAGISSQTRGIERLLEQGARAARIVGRFSCADDARRLEAALCAQPGILETMRASLKVRLLCDERFDAAEAQRVLDREAERLAKVDAVAQVGFAPEEVRDLSERYFGGASPDARDMQLAEGCDGECGGACVGMVGSALVFAQDGMNYVQSIKEWESFAVEVLEDEVICSYTAEPQQFSLF